MKKALVLLALVVGITIAGISYYKWEDIKSGTPYVIATFPPKISRPILLSLLDSEDEIIAAGAAYHLGRVGGDEVYSPLTKAINHPIPMVRHNAINAMIFLKQSDRAISETIKCTDNIQEEPFVIDSAIGLLSQQKQPENKVVAIDALKRLTKRNNTNLNIKIEAALESLTQ